MYSGPTQWALAIRSALCSRHEDSCAVSGSAAAGRVRIDGQEQENANKENAADQNNRRTSRSGKRNSGQQDTNTTPTAQGKKTTSGPQSNKTTPTSQQGRETSRKRKSRRKSSKGQPGEEAVAKVAKEDGGEVAPPVKIRWRGQALLNKRNTTQKTPDGTSTKVVQRTHSSCIVILL